MWDTITYKGEDFKLGDDVQIVVVPGDEIYQGFLNVIEREYIVLVGTGYCAVAGFGNVLGFPLSSVVKIARAEYQPQ